jgi:hypothetical protein
VGAVLVRLQLLAVTRREERDSVGACVVPGVCVLLAGIAETDNEPVGGQD